MKNETPADRNAAVPGDPFEGNSGLIMREPLIFELGGMGRRGQYVDSDGSGAWESLVPSEYRRKELPLPELTEPEVVRHYTRLSQWNFSVDTGFYPLGSCTMKYNPKVNEDVAALPGFGNIHPYAGESFVQGALQLMFELEHHLCEITGMDAMTLQPAAGAHGELTGMLVIRAYHLDRGKPRLKVLIPDSAHGTNPSSCSLCGFQVVQVPSDERGLISPDAVEKVMDEDVAALMLTNPNTLGLFEEDIIEIVRIVHDKGGVVYCDGANLNALAGVAKVGHMGIDLIHLNLHKTFSTPHGGGGPGSGPLGVKEFLASFLPAPRVVKKDDAYHLEEDRPKSIGRVKSFYGHFGVMVKAFAYILMLGGTGIREATQIAVVNANYIRQSLKEIYDLPYDRYCKHECVFSDLNQTKNGVHAIDIAKRLMDYGFHPPTMYFPLIVKGALMIEPTETETKETLDRFILAMKTIAEEAEKDPDLVKSSPHVTGLSRLDEVAAARKPKLVADLSNPVIG